jgi:hypothetical protein
MLNTKELNPYNMPIKRTGIKFMLSGIAFTINPLILVLNLAGQEVLYKKVVIVTLILPSMKTLFKHSLMVKRISLRSITPQ